MFAPRHPQLDRPAPDEEGIYRLNTSFAGAQALGAPPDYPIMLAPGPLLTSKLPLRDLDVLHTMHPFLAGQLALRWGRLSSAPVVYTAHTQYEQYLHYAPMPGGVGRAVVRQHVASFARRVNRVLAPGRAMRDMLHEYGFAGEIELFPNPVDLAAFQAADGREFRARHHLPQDVPLIVYLGRLAPEKNLKVMLHAFEQARASRPEARLLVVGDGPSLAELRAQSREGVTFTGPVPYAQVPGALAAADVFLTASTSEVLPMSMIEALAAGTPLVAAHSPAALDLIEEGVNGTVREAVAGSLAEGLLSVLHPERLPAMQQAARQSAAQYDLTTRSAALEQVYQEVRAGRKRRRG